ncbi:DUF881 domain-containing protein [Propioniciclava soli]|uniref:DUF881 domain-containing protein n=1 Tax=Propioniciclava soli TaxID=2775081 RepID=A0ABZ3C5Q9_9ACTN|nr:DUF881 domain-containing protein [Propioniciclava soli]
MAGRDTSRTRRARQRLGAARSRFATTASPLRLLTVLACVVAGFMMATGALASRGNDLRPDRTTELSRLVAQEADRADALARDAATLRAEVDELTQANASRAAGPDAAEIGAAAEAAASVAVVGPAVTVTLTDAPASVQPAGVDADLLVVHQQDIQAVANALWAGGAEAMTIQGQRVSSRTGIKCVGNTVVLHGVPYAPPYVITAVGDQAALERALADSAYLDIYRQYVDAYRLGYAVARTPEARLAAYEGPATFDHARVAGR